MKVQYMIHKQKNTKQNYRSGEKCPSSPLLHGKCTMCRAGRQKNIIMWSKGQTESKIRRL